MVHKKSKPVQQPKIEQTKSKEATPSADPMVNWKTYQNFKYKFGVKYPEDFYITWEGMWGKEGSKDSQFVIDLSKYKVAPGTGYSGIRMIISNFSGDLYKYVEEKSKQYGTSNFDAKKTKILIAEEKIDDMTAYKVLNNIYFAKNGKLFSINNGVDINLFNQILSTFKFLDQK